MDLKKAINTCLREYTCFYPDNHLGNVSQRAVANEELLPAEGSRQATDC